MRRPKFGVPAERPRSRAFVRASPVPRTIRVILGPDGVAVDHAARTVWVISTNGAVSVIDEASGKVIRTIPTGNGPNKVAVDPTAHIAYATNAYWYRVQVIDQATNSVAATIPMYVPDAVAVEPAAHTAYVTAGGFSSGIVDVIQTCR
jgi:serine/threonine protein kinase, bacterial